MRLEIGVSHRTRGKSELERKKRGISSIRSQGGEGQAFLGRKSRNLHQQLGGGNVRQCVWKTENGLSSLDTPDRIKE